MQQISTYIREDEEVIMVLSGIKKMKSMSKHDFESVLVCTNSRMLMLNRNNLLNSVKSKLVSVSYQNLNDVILSKGILYDTLIIDTKGEKLRISMGKDISEIVQRFDVYNILMQLKRQNGKQGNSSQHSVPFLKQQLLVLKELHDLGILTGEEFKKRKAKILSQ